MTRPFPLDASTLACRIEAPALLLAAELRVVGRRDLGRRRIEQRGGDREGEEG